MFSAFQALQPAMVSRFSHCPRGRQPARSRRVTGGSKGSARKFSERQKRSQNAYEKHSAKPRKSLLSAAHWSRINPNESPAERPPTDAESSTCSPRAQILRSGPRACLHLRCIFHIVPKLTSSSAPKSPAPSAPRIPPSQAGLGGIHSHQLMPPR